MSRDLDRMLQNASEVAGLQGSVSSALASLGGDAEEIAENLAADGVTGERYQPASCPVALWLAGNLPGPAPHQVRVDQRDVLVEVGETRLQIPSPTPVSHFVERFDSGEFPELEGSRPRIVHLGGVGDFYASVDDIDPDDEEEL